LILYSLSSVFDVSAGKSGERVVILIVLSLIVVAVALVLLLLVGSLWLQGFIYSEPADAMHWRALATGGILTVFVAGWCLLNYRYPGSFDAVFNFSPTETKQYDSFIAVKRLDEKTTRNISYTLLKSGIGGNYVDTLGHPWRRSDTDGIIEAIEVKDGANTIRFKAELTPEGQFKTSPVRYVEEGGRRYMTEDLLGTVETRNWRLLFVYTLLNLLHLVLWFVCFWLIIRFQFSHALGLAFVFWGVMTLFVMPMLLDQARVLGEEKAAATATACKPAMRIHVEARMCMMSPSCTI
jgi:hypothetical protein